MKNINDIISTHPFFKEFAESDVELVSGCGKNVVFQPGENLALEGGDANEFFLIREGKVGVYAIIPNADSALIQTVSGGEMLGWSWLFPPYKWSFEVRAIDTTRAVSFDGQCLRNKLDNDPALGYKMMKRFASLMINRLNATRLQLLDVYGK